MWVLRKLPPSSLIAMELVLSQEATISKGHPPRTRNLYGILIISFHFDNFSTLVPFLGEASTLILYHDVISGIQWWEGTRVLIEVFQRLDISRSQCFFFSAPGFSPTITDFRVIEHCYILVNIGQSVSKLPPK